MAMVFIRTNENKYIISINIHQNKKCIVCRTQNNYVLVTYETYVAARERENFIEEGRGILCGCGMVRLAVRICHFLPKTGEIYIKKAPAGRSAPN
jgi:hypothetical protein